MCRKLIYALCLTFSFYSASAKPQEANYGMVVSDQALATQAGVDILRAGGNAIDAAVAVGYALAVVTPCCGNIGGGGFMTIHFADGKNVFLNFREKAPLHAQENMFAHQTEKSVKGYLAVAVPGTVLGFEKALHDYGTLSRDKVIAPAIKLAEEGFIVSPFQARRFSVYAKYFREQPNVAAIFLKDGHAYRAGDRFIQKDLANTLKLIAKTGAEGFYHGPIAKQIVTASELNGGVLTLDDFAQYNVEEKTPLYCQYRGYTIISSPPPSSGGVTLCEMLNILENFPLANLSPVTRAHYIIEAMRYAYIDRNTKLGDPDFVTNPIEQLIAKDYAHQISERILQADKPILFSQPKHESINTTHYSVIDSKGNAVAVTYTLNGDYGAKVIAGQTGFFLNNEMDDFAVQPGTPNQFGLVQSSANNIQPGKRPLSSMTPTIVLKDGKVFMVIGSPGGPRIITSVLLSLINVIDYGMKIQDAVNAPRFHYQAEPDIVDVEPLTFSFLTENKLQYMGYHLSLPFVWSAVEAILVNENGKIEGGRDIRRPDGAAIRE